MSLFKKVHRVTVPAEYLDKGTAPIELRFSQLNAKKMGKANLNDTLDAIDRQNTIMAKLSDEQRQASLDRQRTHRCRVDQAGAGKAPRKRIPFDDFDQHTLIALAHVEHQAEPRRGVVRTHARPDIDELTVHGVASR